LDKHGAFRRTNKPAGVLAQEFDMKLVDRKDLHRINCRIPSEECPECLQFLGFKIVAEELKRLKKHEDEYM
jgi:hypothetical protein